MRNIKIGLRLITGFVLIALLTVNLGFVGHSALRDTKAGLEKVSSVHLPGIEALARVRFNLRSIMVVQRTLLLPGQGKSEHDFQRTALKQYREAYSEALKDYEAIPHPPAERQALEEFKTLLPKVKQDNDRIFALIDEWAKDPANEEKRLKAAEASMTLGRDSNTVLMDGISKLFDLTMRSSKKDREEADAEASKDSKTMAAFMLATPALALAIGLYLTWSLLTPLRKGVAFASAVAEGRLDEVLDVRQRDEIGQLADKLRVMVAVMNKQLAFSQGVMRGVAAPFSVFSPQDTTLYTNQAMLDLLEIPGKPEDYFGQQSGEYILGVKGKETLSTRALREKKLLFADPTVESRSGKKLHVHVSSSPFFDEKGELLGTVSIWLDQTEAIEARAKAEQAKAEGMLQAANKLSCVVEIVGSASEELSSQIEQSSRGAEVQAQRVGETASSMSQMNATVLEVARSASEAAHTTDEAKRQAEDGAVVVGKVVAGIDQVQTQALGLKADMSTLGGQAEGIGRVMGVISDIADQTNLLALNAAIEAARAGDAGRGFAVVADEVRKLAEKTMTATKEVGEAIHGIQQGTRINIENVDKAVVFIQEATAQANLSGQALRRIVSLVEQAADQVRAIATASEEQSAASEEISRSIEDVSQVSSETSSAMTQSAQAVGELAQQAQILRNLIQELQSEGHG